MTGNRVITIASMILYNTCSKGEEWKKIRSAASKQVIPRRVANFTAPLSVVSDNLAEQFEIHKDQDAYISDIRDFMARWAFQGNYYTPCS